MICVSPNFMCERAVLKVPCLLRVNTCYVYRQPSCGAVVCGESSRYLNSILKVFLAWFDQLFKKKKNTNQESSLGTSPESENRDRLCHCGFQRVCKCVFCLNTLRKACFLPVQHIKLKVVDGGCVILFSGPSSTVEATWSPTPASWPVKDSPVPINPTVNAPGTSL